MPTENPKISSYVPQPIFDRFKQYQEENDCSMSQALALILSEYFGLQGIVPSERYTLTCGGVTLAQFEEMKERLQRLELDVESMKSSSKKAQPKISQLSLLPD